MGEDACSVVSGNQTAVLADFICRDIICVGLFGASGLGCQTLEESEQDQGRKEKEKLERQQKEELDQMKFHFFTNISHEFRTPLALIMTLLGILIKEECDAEKKQRLGFIYP